MPKNLKRGNREAKKPKQPKTKVTVANSIFTAAHAKAPPTAPTKG